MRHKAKEPTAHTMRIEYCTCDYKGCGAKADVDHNTVAPKEWSQFTDIPVPGLTGLSGKNYHLCPECAAKVRALLTP